MSWNLDRLRAGQASVPLRRILFVCTGNYYRSRFAEAVFNHHAEAAGLEWRAFSRGLAIHLAPENPLLSEHTSAGLAQRGIPLHHTGPERVQISESDLMAATRVVALKEDEHRPMFLSQFPGWVDRVTFWDVSDLDRAEAVDALPAIEALVLSLLDEFKSLLSDRQAKEALARSALVWTYGQPWLPREEDAFAPGRVSLGLWGNELLVRADLHDADVMPDSFPLNYPAFTVCDAFEIFVGPEGESVYYELHVTPSNSILQLRFDGALPRLELEQHKVAMPLFHSQTWISSEGWGVVARIPLKNLFPEAHASWRLSFGRYDHTPGLPKPVISTTSPHTVCNFHRKHEWRRISLAEIPLF